MEQIYKYPRTHHIEGSRLQPGDEDLTSIPFSAIKDKYLVIEEKMDGANCAVSFSEKGQIQLQSRGHYLTGGRREKHFNLFKTWAASRSGELWQMLSNRYIMYGEWLFAKHTVYYDQLPHYFMEFDILDLASGNFLSTQKRREILTDCSFIHSVAVLGSGRFKMLDDITRFIRTSGFISSDYKDNLAAACKQANLSVERTFTETDLSGLMEGLYIKVEENGIVSERLKFVRKDFLNTVLESNSHWLNRPIIPNNLAKGNDLFK